MKLTITQGIAHNKLRHLNRRRNELVRSFNFAAEDHRDTSGRYIPGRHRGADYLLGEISKVDKDVLIAQIAQRFDTSNKTAREKVENMILAGQIKITETEKRPEGGHPIVWLKSSK